MQVDNLIIDGTNIEFRIFCIAKKMTTINDIGAEVPVVGEQSNCTFRFLQTFLRLVDKFNPTNVYASWDKRLQPHSTNFRKDILVNQYKAGRVKIPNIQEMYDQEIILIEMLESIGVKNIFPNVLEADDVCAWLATTVSGTSIVVSADQDLLQLVTPNTSVYNLKEIITYKNFKDLKGVDPEQFVLFKSIKGDPSDNISGLPGYGDVRSRRLAINWQNTELTEEYKLLVERNIKLIDLRFGFNHQAGEKQKYEEQLNYLKNIRYDIDRFKSLCIKHQFTSIINDFDKWNRLVKRNNIVDIINRLA